MKIFNKVYNFLKKYKIVISVVVTIIGLLFANKYFFKINIDVLNKKSIIENNSTSGACSPIGDNNSINCTDTIAQRHLTEEIKANINEKLSHNVKRIIINSETNNESWTFANEIYRYLNVNNYEVAINDVAFAGGGVEYPDRYRISVKNYNNSVILEINVYNK